MKPVAPLEFPREQQAAYTRARRLEWVSLAHLATSTVFTFLVMGSSQAMRTSWLDGIISFVPPVAFLVASHVARRRPSKRYPYGRHGAVALGYVTASLALLAMGTFLLYEALHKLATVERTTIGGMELFGTVMWAGWPMLVALAYASIPSVFLGRAKLALAPAIHDKVLYADAEMNRADWMSQSAAAVGVMGTGLGLWWMDAAAAALVSTLIVKDGVSNLRVAAADLMEESPRTIGAKPREDPLPARLASHLESFDFVEKARVRLREDGHVFLGEAFVVLRDQRGVTTRVAELAEAAKAFSWRIQELVVMPVTREWLEAEEARISASSSP